ncbi:incA family protein, partial [Chlamydia psittaci C1/97]|jgi:predicted RNase H-like nuclease (RuvC/YqgF family)
VHL